MAAPILDENDADIPHNAGVAIEFTIPQTSKRVDFIVTANMCSSSPATQQ